MKRQVDGGRAIEDIGKDWSSAVATKQEDKPKSYRKQNCILPKDYRGSGALTKLHFRLEAFRILSGFLSVAFSYRFVLFVTGKEQRPCLSLPWSAGCLTEELVEA